MTAWQDMRTRVDALLDQLDALIDDLVAVSEYELLVWIAAHVDGRIADLPPAPKDPWARLLAMRDGFPTAASCALTPAVSFQWAGWAGGTQHALVERAQGERYRISVDWRCGNRAMRRAVLAHELAHIDLGNITHLGAHWDTHDRYRDANRANELATDLRAGELFDIDVSLLTATKRAAA